MILIPKEVQSRNCYTYRNKIYNLTFQSCLKNFKSSFPFVFNTQNKRNIFIENNYIANIQEFKILKSLTYYFAGKGEIKT